MLVHLQRFNDTFLVCPGFLWIYLVTTKNSELRPSLDREWKYFQGLYDKLESFGPSEREIHGIITHILCVFLFDNLPPFRLSVGYHEGTDVAGGVIAQLERIDFEFCFGYSFG
jgi:hypothetical protein